MKKIKYLGKIRMEGDRIIKTYGNSEQGSAFKKVPCDIIVMVNAGHKKIAIECEDTDKYIDDYKTLIEMTLQNMPYFVDVILRIIKTPT